MIVLENEYIVCELDSSVPVLKHKWKEPVPGDIFRKYLIEILEKYRSLQKEYPKLAWLADTRFLGEVDKDTEQWFTEVWDDLLFNQANVKYHAVILGEDLFAEYPMEKFKMDAEVKFKKNGIQLGLFSDEEEAYDWVRTR